MADKLLICVIVLLLIIFEEIDSKKPAGRHQESARQVTLHTPVMRTHNVARNKPKKQDEPRQAQEYLDMYQDMVRASQESFESFDDREDKRLRRLIGDDDLKLMAEAESDVGGRRVRSGPLEDSAAGRRRARSQAVRRDKLEAQSIVSHKRHSRSKLPQFGYN